MSLNLGMSEGEFTQNPFSSVFVRFFPFSSVFASTKTTKGTTRVPEISHLRAGNHSETMEKEKQYRSTSRSMITTP